MTSPIRYAIVELDLNAHELVIRLQVDGPLAAQQRVTLPAWIPGSYVVRDFARCVTAIQASDGGGPLELEKLDKHTWQVGTCDGALTIDYRVYAYDLSVRSAFLDQTRGFLNGASLFLRLQGFEDAAWELEIRHQSRLLVHIGSLQPRYQNSVWTSVDSGSLRVKAISV